MKAPQRRLGEAGEDQHWGSIEEFKHRVRAWAVRIGARPNRIRVQGMTKKWGSCSPNGVLTFSSQLLSKPRRVGEAVIVHELVHLKVPNHGPLFRSLADTYLPGASDPGPMTE